MIKLLTSFLACWCLFFVAYAQNDTLQKVTAGRKNSPEQMRKPYIIIISADGFRYDYAQKYHAENLLKLAAGGVKAKYMIPSYPSVTHSNHFAIMSGLYPAHSGVVGNDFYDAATRQKFKPEADGKWFHNDPIWVTAEKQHLLTASFWWIDAAALINGIRPTYYVPNNDKEKGIDYRVKTIYNWLNLPEDKRPHFISMYFPGTDHSGHSFGPDSPETEKAVAFIDETVGKIVDAAKSLSIPVNFIFLSDHGMTAVDQEHPLYLPKEVDRQKFVIVSLGPALNLYAKNPADISATYNKLKSNHPVDYDIYLKKNVPAKLHYGTKDDIYNRIGDIVLMAKWPKTFIEKGTAPAGTHGFDPDKVKDMDATFFAWGPVFKKNKQIAPFKNVEVYDVMTQILGIQPLPNDGDGTLAKKILK